MIDKYKRNIEYIRISVTDRCNFRCSYCMPLEGVEYMEHDKILSFEEILEVVKYVVELGVKKVKITGGEPFVRKGIMHLIQSIKTIEGIEQVTMTTNGLLLKKYADEILSVGVDGINVSFDTFHPEKFKRITHSTGELKEIIDGMDYLLAQGFKNIKLNMVPIQGVNDDEIITMVQFAKSRNIPLRFIELMPIGCGASFTGLTPDKVKVVLSDAYGEILPYHQRLGNGPAEYYDVDGVKVGFISAVSDKFCASCNRVRLTADGFLKTCLHYDYGINLRTLLRDGQSKEVIIAKMKACIQAKPEKHVFHLKNVDHEENKKMFQIGG